MSIIRPFVCCVEDFHNVFHWADGVLVFQKVCGKSVFSVIVFEVPEMFLEPYSELSCGLSGVLHTARGASQLVNSTVIIFTSGVLVPCCQKFSYDVVCAEGDFDVSVGASWYETILLCKYLIAATLCSLGWQSDTYTIEWSHTN